MIIEVFIFKRKPLAFLCRQTLYTTLVFSQQKLKIIQRKIPGLCCRGRLYQAKVSTAFRPARPR